MEKHEPRKFLTARYLSCRFLFQVLVILGLCTIVYKAFQLQVIEHSVWVDRANAQLNTTFQVPAYRGSIYDRNGRLLSYSVPQRSLYTAGFSSASLSSESRKLAQRLGPVLGEPQQAIEKKLASARHFTWIKRHLTDQQAWAVENLNGQGLNLINEYKRFYPHRQVGGQIVGFVGMDGVGLEGVEKSFDEILRGCSVPVGQMRDGTRKCLWMNSSAPPEPAESLGVKLTIDAFIQYLAECELEKAVQKYKARAGEVVVMDAQTSEVLAMANWPFFDPNLPDKNDAQLWRNRTVTDSFEPGSTFKVFLMSAALDENMVRERDRIYCEAGKCSLAGHQIKDVHPYGWLTMPEVIKFSSNIGAAKIALHVGSERYARYIHGFGFGSLSGIQLPGEVKGLVRPYRRWRPIDLAVTGFGQAIGVTTLQLTSAISTIANGGEHSPPIIAREIVDGQGKRVQEFHSSKDRRVISKKTADQIRAMMALVTQEGGTGTQAAPEGYSAAGKTGTAQVMDPVTKRYASNKYTAVFTGFTPVEQPKLVISVVVHEPHGAIYGGVIAAPVFRGIAAKALPYLGVTPSLPSPGPNPAVMQVKSNPSGNKGTSAHAAPPGKSGQTSAKQSAANKSAPGKAPAAGAVQANTTNKSREKLPTAVRGKQENPEKFSKAEGSIKSIY